MKKYLIRLTPEEQTHLSQMIRSGKAATERNKANKTLDWQFTAADARTKLKRLYPVIKT